MLDPAVFNMLLVVGTLGEVISWGFIFIVVLFFLVSGFMVFTSISLYIEALTAGAKVPLLDIVFMRFRKVPPMIIVRSYIMTRKAGLNLPVGDLETHYLSRGNVPNVCRALIAAGRAEIELPWKRCAAIDLAGRDVLEAVRMSVMPKVIDCPSVGAGRPTIDAIAKDGIQLKAKARVTVRTNIDRLVGGATEDTVVARVGEGIVTTIGSAESHKDVLENPDRISKSILARGLDSGTAFEILSIDIADIDVGDNIGAQLQADQAEADKRIAQAKAEERRAMAVALEQEMKAKIHENRAKVILAEAEVPKALAQAFRDGNLGVMDYYSLRNIQADTQMRSSISGNGESSSKS